MRKKNSSGRLKKKSILGQWQLYVMLLPIFVCMIVFHYIPLYGLTLAFKDVRLGESIFGGTWVGLANFKRLFQSNIFLNVFSNTLKITIIENFLLWPLPIFFALLVHNSSSRKVAKFSQSATYIPHLLSMVVVVSIVSLFCSKETGIINIILSNLGFDKIYFEGEAKYFLPMYIISGIWSSLGSSAVIYIAALTSVDSELIEAAMIDGAGKLKRIWHIDLPAIRPTIVLLLIMNMGKMLSLGYEKALLMQNSLNLEASEIIGTYVYKTGLMGAQYGFSTAVSLFNNVIGLFLVIVSNFLAKKFAETSLF